MVTPILIDGELFNIKKECMKTAMQELIKWMDDNKSHCTYGTIRGKATELLQSYASHPSPTKTAIECWKSAGNNPDNYSQSVKEAMEEYLQQYTTSHASHLTSSVEIIAEKHADKLYDKNAKTQIMVMECDLWHLRKNNFKDGVLSSSHPSPMSAEQVDEDAIEFADWIIENEYSRYYRGWGLTGQDNKYFTTSELYGFFKQEIHATTPSVKADGLETVKVLWSTLTDEQRLELACCKGCGSLDTSCQCLNDE